MSRDRIVITYKTETLAQVCLLVYKNLGRHDIPKGHKHLQQVLVSELLGQVVDEQVGSFWTFLLAPSSTDTLLCQQVLVVQGGERRGGVLLDPRVGLSEGLHGAPGAVGKAAAAQAAV